MKTSFVKTDLLPVILSAVALFNTPGIFFKNCSRSNVNDLYESRYVEKSELLFLIWPVTINHGSKN
jgi:hypothetical protein